MTKVRVRFAPSPTGFLHVGGVRTALFNYLFARQHQGEFILRLEDTDRERYVAEGVEQIQQSLAWLGLKPDEGFWISKGEHQNVDYVQSERSKSGLYKRYAEQLLKKGLAYYSPTPSISASPSSSPPESPVESLDLDTLREQSKRAKKAFVYRKTMDPANTDSFVANVPIRLDVDAVSKKTLHAIDWQDTVRGQFQTNISDMEDFILIKADGLPTYNFANVVDDHDMAISHVIRGDEFISSTAKHALLYDVLGWPRPAWVHLPAINGTDGKKLSKRTGDTNVLDYRNRGYLAESLINFLALLGWNDGTTQEVFSLNQLIEAFKIKRIQTSPAIFDHKRLDWLNGIYIRQLSTKDLLVKSDGFWPTVASSADPATKRRVLTALQDRLKTLADLGKLADYFFEFMSPSAKSINQLNKAFANDVRGLTLKDWLDQTKSLIEQTKPDRATLEMALKQSVKNVDALKRATLWVVLREILCNGANDTPPIWDIVYALGQAETVRRLEGAVKLL